MIKKIDSDKYMDFWKEYSTNVKLGMIDDAANRTRLAKLLRYVIDSKIHTIDTFFLLTIQKVCLKIAKIESCFKTILEDIGCPTD